MIKAIRIVLIISMLEVAYVAVVACYLFPWLGLLMFLGGLYCLSRKRQAFSAFGRARWAESSDIPHLIRGGQGLVLGHIEGKPGKWAGIKALFDRGLSSWQAVTSYLESCQRKAKRHLVRISA
jgi:hypothetical protein